MSTNNIELSVVMPCLNEKETLPVCIEKIQKYFAENKINGEIVVADNGSTDGSKDIARKAGVVLVEESKKGYGNAYHAGIGVAQGKYIVIGDSDNTYDFLAIGDFLGPLREGYDFVIGNRFSGMMEDGAMPWLHKYIGNPILSGVLRVFFNLKVRDAHCGMRGFTREAYDRLGLQTTGMEYASEMVVAAAEEKLKTKEVPIRYLIRKGESKLNSFSDGWRHLRFMLMYSPNYLFFLPAVVFGVLGLIITVALYSGPVDFAGRTFDLHPLFLGVFLILLAFGFFQLGVYTRVYSFVTGFTKRSKVAKWFMQNFTLEKGLMIGGLLTLGGLLLVGMIMYDWSQNDFAELFEIRRSLVSLLLLSIGVQVLFSSFFLSLLTVNTKTNRR